MKKVKLKIEELSVESFPTDQGVARPGTVFGQETQIADSCGSLSGCDACFNTQECTNNPAMAECYDSYHWCVVTHVHCCGSESGNIYCPGASGMEFC
ncbi:MAG TPA: hypothetical protein VFQ39_20425 [Longimicrobium sp.]|nr:hypothetical protein [Longimicrobium sp.]